MYVAGADPAGNHGCQIRFHRSLGVKATAFEVASPRLLFVTGRRRYDNRIVQIVCGHTLTEVSPPDVKDLFWTDLERLAVMLRQQAPSALLFYLLDANARTTATGDGCIGDVDGERPNDNGERFMQHLRDHALVAYNTHWPCGYTWRSAHGPSARLDYVCGSAAQLSSVELCDMPPEIDLSLTTKEDHRLVRCRPVLGTSALASSSRRLRRLKKLNLSAPWRVELFRDLMWRFDADPSITIDEHVSSLTNYIYTAALVAFGSAEDRPRQPWISAETWAVVRLITPVRRLSYKACIAAAAVRLTIVFLAWAALRRKEFVPEAAGSRLGSNLGWVAASRLTEFRCHWPWLSRIAASSWRACSLTIQSAAACRC